MSNLEKIRKLVDDLTIRDENLLEKVQHLDILEELFRKSPQATAIMEDNWRYILVNDQFATLYGFDTPDDMVGKCHYELFKEIPERPIEEINDQLNENGVWKGVIKSPHRSEGSFISEINIRKHKDKNLLICICIKVQEQIDATDGKG